MKTQYDKNGRFVRELDTTEHPLFCNQPPLSVREMVSRVSRGIPISCSRPVENFPINNSFFTDKFDVLDTALRFDKKLSDDYKRDIAAKREEERQNRLKYEEWLKSQNHSTLPPSE